MEMAFDPDVWYLNLLPSIDWILAYIAKFLDLLCFILPDWMSLEAFFTILFFLYVLIDYLGDRRANWRMDEQYKKQLTAGFEHTAAQNSYTNKVLTNFDGKIGSLISFQKKQDIVLKTIQEWIGDTKMQLDVALEMMSSHDTPVPAPAPASTPDTATIAALMNEMSGMQKAIDGIAKSLTPVPVPTRDVAILEELAGIQNDIFNQFNDLKTKLGKPVLDAAALKPFMDAVAQLKLGIAQLGHELNANSATPLLNIQASLAGIQSSIDVTNQSIGVEPTVIKSIQDMIASIKIDMQTMGKTASNSGPSNATISAMLASFAGLQSNVESMVNGIQSLASASRLDEVLALAKSMYATVENISRANKESIDGALKPVEARITGEVHTVADVLRDIQQRMVSVEQAVANPPAPQSDPAMLAQILAKIEQLQRAQDETLVSRNVESRRLKTSDVAPLINVSPRPKAQNELSNVISLVTLSSRPTKIEYGFSPIISEGTTTLLPTNTTHGFSKIRSHMTTTLLPAKVKLELGPILTQSTTPILTDSTVAAVTSRSEAGRSTDVATEKVTSPAATGLGRDKDTGSGIDLVTKPGKLGQDEPTGVSKSSSSSPLATLTAPGSPTFSPPSRSPSPLGNTTQHSAMFARLIAGLTNTRDPEREQSLEKSPAPQQEQKVKQPPVRENGGTVEAECKTCLKKVSIEWIAHHSRQDKKTMLWDMHNSLCHGKCKHCHKYVGVGNIDKPDWSEHNKVCPGIEKTIPPPRQRTRGKKTTASPQPMPYQAPAQTPTSSRPTGWGTSWQTGQNIGGPSTPTPAAPSSGGLRGSSYASGGLARSRNAPVTRAGPSSSSPAPGAAASPAAAAAASSSSVPAPALSAAAPAFTPSPAFTPNQWNGPNPTADFSRGLSGETGEDGMPVVKGNLRGSQWAH